MRLYEQAAPLAGFGAWECHLPTQRLSWTDGVYDLFDIRRGTVVHRPSIVDLYRDRSRRTMERARSACISGGTGFALDCEILTTAGEARWMRLTGRVAFEHGRAYRLFGSKQDVTREKTLWNGLEQQLLRDPLTGLSNRRAFDGVLLRLGGLRDDGVETALALVDLDRFKAINDEWGHAAGDASLREVAQRLARALPGAPMLARIGGDEFAVVLASRLGRRALRRTFDGVHRALNRPFDWNGRELALSVSMGIAFTGGATQDLPATAFAQADSALYIAKAQGGGSVHAFGEALDTLAALAPTGPLRETG
jgi:diguanylate cyclase (GGDEF)-like protein